MVPLCFLSLPFFLLPWLSLAQGPIHVQLQHRGDLRSRSINDYAKEAEGLRLRYGYPLSSHGKRATAAIPMINQKSDSSYLASITVGTPPQSVDVVLDTGSTDLWVATTSCSSCSRSTTLFNTAASTSYKSSSSAVGITYGSGRVSGTVGQDTVSMGEFTIPNQTLLAVTQVSSGLVDGAVSGIMGLAWTPLASTRAPPFWINLAENNQLTSTDMSFWFTRQINNPGAPTHTFGGIFTLGGVNSSLYTGDIEFLPLPIPTPSFWLLGLSRMTVNGGPVTVRTGMSALSAIDTGTTLIGGPSDDVATIWAAVPDSAPSTTHPGFYSFPCATKVSVTMAFGTGKSWNISTADMNLGALSTTSTRCMGAIFDLTMGSDIPAGGDSPAWVVGDTFLKNVYSVFRASPPSIGFAQLSAAASAGSGAGQITRSTISTLTTRTRDPNGPASGAPNGTTSGSGSNRVVSSTMALTLLGIMLSSLMTVLFKM